MVDEEKPQSAVNGYGIYGCGVDGLGGVRSEWVAGNIYLHKSSFVDGKLVEDNVVYVNSVYLEGTVASDTGIVSLRWRSNRGGGGNVQLFIGKFGETNLNGKWRIPKVPLAMGANTITIEAKSVNGKLFSKQVTIYRR